jgi:hypothetical protein
MLRRIQLLLLAVFSLIILLTLNPRSGLAQGTPDASTCTAFAIDPSGTGFPEVQGKSRTQELWALLFPYHLPIWVDEEVKIVWRMTGTGDLKLSARHPDGTTVTPIWGPEEHGGSNWHHPGAEWGAGFKFPETGCWRITAQRGKDTGEVDLLVVPRQDIEF